MELKTSAHSGRVETSGALEHVYREQGVLGSCRGLCSVESTQTLSQ